MDLNLSPQIADATVFEGEGGGYYAWTPAKSPALLEAEVAAGKLVLQPRAFALPHYADSYKIGYVLQGTCTVGLVSPNSPQEKVLIINGGDAIPVSAGNISWWFNGGDSDVTIVFLGKGSKSYTPGQFNYFFLAGPLGFLGAFSTDFITKIYHFDKSDDSDKLVKSQTKPLIVKLGPEINMPTRSNSNLQGHVFNLTGHHEMTAENIPLLDKFGLSASLAKLETGSVWGPNYSTDNSDRIIYVTKGRGRVQIVGLNGTLSLDSSVEEDQLFVVPKFFAVAQLAGEQGLEFICVSTSPRPELGKLVGSESAWNALSPSVLQASLSVSPEFVKLFESKI